MTRETLSFPPTSIPPLEPYLPLTSPSPSSKPHLTLTYATSLDASLSLAPGVRTTLSGPHSKSMTHYLRTRHNAILVGCTTALVDNPALNSRLGSITSLDQQPRPIILDPKGRWDFTEDSQVIRLAAEFKGKGPWVVTKRGGETKERGELLERVGGKFLFLETGEDGRFKWGDVLSVLGEQGVRSVMVEGGGEVINSLLIDPENRLVDSVIITIAPTWLGKGGVVVSPSRQQGQTSQLKLRDVSWQPHGEDVVLCGRILRS
ncbi:2,5-diamino-6-(ribosylamino)-4(3H)-pyrimidinone 5'-phosphate reductase [Podospora pseudoanserina]|uniref:2,5-diamino-6-ribosylamino-4(3H)-pyrimidinone 5'-phosphate reductase n=1 Tax=Podospora pseudoanserina TaxID=2609844 RepID=A0ABR0HSQ8_9PEZI|nr:2,5-diamino-6-(ribosylamino)-4(3H)-pyrimidinone 5'-phosphate reductase [Podospora pseudoanserina]